MDGMVRIPIAEQQPAVRAKNFDEVCLGYTEEEAVKEAGNRPVLPHKVVVVLLARVFDAVEAQRGVFIQLGAFSSPEAAQTLANRARATLGALASLVRTEQAGAHTRVQIGPFANRAEALNHLPAISQTLGLQPFVVER